MIMLWVVSGAFRWQFHQTMLGGTFGQLRAFLAFFDFLEGCNRECLGRRPDRFMVKCYPGKMQYLVERESRKIKALEQVPTESAPIAALVTFFCHIPLDLIVVTR
jgi:hypothetical protein